jgi:hypothetical protein
VLGLGTHLVRELGRSRSNDTLARWLSHHVAELINAVEQAKSPTEKVQKLSQATDLILRIWERRDALPGEANPLGRFREAISVLLKFDQPYAYFSNRQVPARQALANKISNDSRRLELFVKLLDAGVGEKAQDPIDEAALEALSGEELDALQRLLFLSKIVTGPKAANPNAHEGPTKVTAQGLVTGMISDLDKMQKLLQEPAKSKARRKPQKKRS